MDADAKIVLTYDDIPSSPSPLLGPATMALVEVFKDRDTMPAFQGIPEAHMCSGHAHVYIAVEEWELDEWIEWAKLTDEHGSNSQCLVHVTAIPVNEGA